MTNRSKATTHADDCWSWGPAHYDCAVREIERLAEALQEAKKMIRDLLPDATFTKWDALLRDQEAGHEQ